MWLMCDSVYSLKNVIIQYVASTGMFNKKHSPDSSVLREPFCQCEDLRWQTLLCVMNSYLL